MLKNSVNESVFVSKSIRLTAQKMKFPLRISSVNMTKSQGNDAFGHIY